ncbi:hypothetical protein C8Q78DRAFT_1077369 [Trametes maxima]|nr:hypothetical protein C8Q78DRAFT_1077369 [Trametes maxima]
MPIQGHDEPMDVDDVGLPGSGASSAVASHAADSGAKQPKRKRGQSVATTGGTGVSLSTGDSRKKSKNAQMGSATSTTTAQNISGLPHATQRSRGVAGTPTPKSKNATVPPKPRPLTNQVHTLVPINVDESSSEEDTPDMVISVVKPPKAATKANQAPSTRMVTVDDHYNDEGEESSDGEASPEELEDERSEVEPRDEDCVDIAAEAISFAECTTQDQLEDPRTPHRVDQRPPAPHASSTASSNGSGLCASPASYDDDDPSSPGNDNPNRVVTETPGVAEPASSVRHKSKKEGKRNQKLASEMPILRPGKPLAGSGKPNTTKHTASVPGPTVNTSNTAAITAISWHPRTEVSNALTNKSTGTYAVRLLLLGPEMKAVLQGSFEQGKIFLAFGDGMVYTDPKDIEDMTTPFCSQGILNISKDALITVAENLGYGGEYDIADRLEKGDPKFYVTPLANYTACRIRPYRTEIKQAALHVYPATMKLDSLSLAQLQSLLEGGNFIYPPLTQGRYQYKQPFCGPGVVEVLQAAFFADVQPNNVGTQNINMLTSSLDSHPHELEIPDYMLAISACAIQSVIHDRVHPTADKSMSDFAGPTIENAFKAFMKILLGKRERSLTAYHEFMHELCTKVTGGRATKLHSEISQADILARVDWDDSDDTPTVA